MKRVFGVLLAIVIAAVVFSQTGGPDDDAQDVAEAAPALTIWQAECVPALTDALKIAYESAEGTSSEYAMRGASNSVGRNMMADEIVRRMNEEQCDLLAQEPSRRRAFASLIIQQMTGD